MLSCFDWCRSCKFSVSLMMVTSSSSKYLIKKNLTLQKFCYPLDAKSINKKIINENVRKLFRDIEKKSIKLIETKFHRAFNEWCVNNNLLPNYTNIYIINRQVHLYGQIYLINMKQSFKPHIYKLPIIYTTNYWKTLLKFFFVIIAKSKILINIFVPGFHFLSNFEIQTK